MSQAEDMDAIDQYMHSTPAKTAQAASILTSWQGWYGGLSFWNRRFDDATYSEARKRRNDFNLANATSPVEAQQVQAVIDSGMTTEQMQMDPTLAKPAPVRRNMPPVPGQRPVLRRWMKINPDFVQETTDWIKQWQRILGLFPDGRFGKDTEKGTKQFQSVHGLPVTGVVDAATWAASSAVTSQAPLAGPMQPTPGVTPGAPFQGFRPAPSPGRRSGGSTATTSPDAPGGGGLLAPVKREVQKVSQAGMMSGITNLPTPVKIVGGGLVLGLGYYYGMKYKKHGHF